MARKDPPSIERMPEPPTPPEPPPPAAPEPALPIAEFASMARRYRAEYEWVNKMADFAEDCVRRETDAAKAERRQQLAVEARATLEDEIAARRLASETEATAQRADLEAELQRGRQQMQTETQEHRAMLKALETQIAQAQTQLQAEQEKLRAFRVKAIEEHGALTAKLDALKGEEQALRDRLTAVLR